MLNSYLVSGRAALKEKPLISSHSTRLDVRQTSHAGRSVGGAVHNVLPRLSRYSQRHDRYEPSLLIDALDSAVLTWNGRSERAGPLG